MTGRHGNLQETILTNNNNEIILGKEDKLMTQKEYIHKYFVDEILAVPPLRHNQMNEKSPEITQEVIHATKVHKHRNVISPDTINVLVWRYFQKIKSKA